MKNFDKQIYRMKRLIMRLDEGDVSGSVISSDEISHIIITAYFYQVDLLYAFFFLYLLSILF